MSYISIDWKGAGYIDSLIGGIILVVQGFLTIFGGSAFVGYSALSETGIAILNGIIMIVFGLLILILVWEWFQRLVKTGPWIKNHLVLGIVLLVLGLVAGGIGGILTLIGGILFIIGAVKTV